MHGLSQITWQRVGIKFTCKREVATDHAVSPYFYSVNGEMAAGAMYLMTSLPEAENSAHGTDWVWKEFLSEPSKWWDNRRTKRSPKQPGSSRTKLPNSLCGWIGTTIHLRLQRSPLAVVSKHSISALNVLQILCPPRSSGRAHTGRAILGQPILACRCSSRAVIYIATSRRRAVFSAAFLLKGSATMASDACRSTAFLHGHMEAKEALCVCVCVCVRGARTHVHSSTQGQCLLVKAGSQRATESEREGRATW
ncbi:hypothetical protein L7F22_046340 [Adiantum nelumboides]|nr:hypothetical protein [Adiantum nelumboides]